MTLRDHQRFVVGTLLSILVCLLPRLLPLLTAAGAAPKSSGRLKIGVIAPLSGVAAEYGQAIKNGIELAASAILWDYRVRATIDFLDTEDKATGDELGRRARIGGSLGIERAMGPWTWGLEWNGQGRRYDRTPNTAANRMGGYGLLNAYVHYALAPDWSVEVRANNLLDKDYELAQNYGTQGANAFVAVRYAMH